MRGTKAKALRRSIYNGKSTRAKTYQPGHEPQPYTNMRKTAMGTWVGTPNPTCICTGLRRAYQDAKSAR